jgi:3-deoxy-D-manno-octulosonate 8-phosphate phosphatase (KDO 8-P phosphatase)
MVRLKQLNLAYASYRSRFLKRYKGLNIADIDLIVYDFDGVMTDNKVITFQDGTEGVTVNRADGLGVAMIKERGIPQLILSSDSNPVVEARAAKIGLPVIYNTCDKRSALEEYCSVHVFDPSRVVYVGNDLNDKEVMKFAGIPIAPADAHPEILRIARIVLNAIGGGGVVRELAAIILFSSTSGRITRPPSKPKV